jgi:hypothetical protein
MYSVLAEPMISKCIEKHEQKEAQRCLRVWPSYSNLVSDLDMAWLGLDATTRYKPAQAMRLNNA